MRPLNLLLLLLLSTTFCLAQEEEQPENKSSKINLPNIPGFLTLKCDLHMHTVFSDGHVWPTFRVSEAAKAGLDAISMTEHVDAEYHATELTGRREYAFKTAQEFATKKKLKLLLIKGIEISPRIPPYHNNALFLTDLDNIPTPYMKPGQSSTFQMKEAIKKEELMVPFIEAKKQGAFTVYNHPNYKWWDGTHKDVFTPFHKELLEKGIMKGVEVVNGQRYNIFAHQIAEKYNLTMVAGSDAHEAINHSGSNGHRPMTLVFAKERTVESIKEAMLARRTAVYTREFVIGRQPELDAFFKASLKMTAKKVAGKFDEGKIQVKITNNSDIPYQVYLRSPYPIDNTPLNLVTLQPNGITTVLMEPVWEYPKEFKLGFKVVNLLVGVDKSLETEITIPLQ